jgi:hypothetical protein
VEEDYDEFEELQSTEKNQTWELVNLSDKKKKIDVK